MPIVELLGTATLGLKIAGFLLRLSADKVDWAEASGDASGLVNEIRSRARIGEAQSVKLGRQAARHLEVQMHRQFPAAEDEKIDLACIEAAHVLEQYGTAQALLDALTDPDLLAMRLSKMQTTIDEPRLRNDTSTLQHIVTPKKRLADDRAYTIFLAALTQAITYIGANAGTSDRLQAESWARLTHELARANAATAAQHSELLELSRAILRHVAADNAALADVGSSAQLAQGYADSVKSLAPSHLVGREAEVWRIWDFVSRSTSTQYLVILAGPWAGKTALMASLALNPPVEVLPVFFFVLGREESSRSREGFLRQTIPQLALICDRTSVPAFSTSTEASNLFRSLLREAGLNAKARNRHLVLLVDGLDEDLALRDPQEGRGSIAGLLPPLPPEGVKVVTAMRPNPPLPNDVPTSHPLRSGTETLELSSSPMAEFARVAAIADLRDLLASSLGLSCSALIAASGGALSAEDLAELSGETRRDVSDTLEKRSARTFTPTSYPGENYDAFRIGHDKLDRLLVQMVGTRGPDPDDCSEGEWADFRRTTLMAWHLRIVEWALEWSGRGWGGRTPGYLLDDACVSLLTEYCEDANELLRFVGSRSRNSLLKVRRITPAVVVRQVGSVLSRVLEITQSPAVVPDELLATAEACSILREHRRLTGAGGVDEYGLEADNGSTPGFEAYVVALAIDGLADYALATAAGSTNAAALITAVAYAAGARQDSVTVLSALSLYRDRFSEKAGSAHLAQFAAALWRCGEREVAVDVLTLFFSHFREDHGRGDQSVLIRERCLSAPGETWGYIFSMSDAVADDSALNEVVEWLSQYAVGEEGLAQRARTSAGWQPLICAAWAFFAIGELDRAAACALRASTLAEPEARRDGRRLLSLCGLDPDEYPTDLGATARAEWNLVARLRETYLGGPVEELTKQARDVLSAVQSDGDAYRDVLSVEAREGIFAQIPVQSGSLHLKCVETPLSKRAIQTLEHYVIGPHVRYFCLSEPFRDDLFDANTACLARVLDVPMRLGRVDEALPFIRAHFADRQRDRMLARASAVCAIRGDHQGALDRIDEIANEGERATAQRACWFYYGMTTGHEIADRFFGAPPNSDPEGHACRLIITVLHEGDVDYERLPENEDGAIDGLLAALMTLLSEDVSDLRAEGIRNRQWATVVECIRDEELRKRVQRDLEGASRYSWISVAPSHPESDPGTPEMALEKALACRTVGEYRSFALEHRDGPHVALADWASFRALVLSAGRSIDAETFARTRLKELVRLVNSLE